MVGRRKSPASIYPALLREIERPITECCATEFLVGYYGSFDHAPAYHPAERAVDLPDGFDGSLYPSGMKCVSRNLSIIRTNRFAPSRADCFIAFVCRPAGSAFFLLVTENFFHPGFICLLTPICMI